MNRTAPFLGIGTVIGIGLAANFVWCQQATPPLRVTTVPLTAAELEAIPLVLPLAGRSVTKALFDGKTLNGWRGNLDWWSVADGTIVGKASDKVPTSFLFTNNNYSDFRLIFSSRMVESENHAGICFWGEIAEQGANQWYTHGPLVIFPNPSMWDYNAGKGLRVYKTTTEKVTGQHEWVKVEVLAQGNRVRTAFNGIQVMEWRESDSSRIKEGPIGVQLHAATVAQEVRYKDLVIETLPKENKLITLKH